MLNVVEKDCQQSVRIAYYKDVLEYQVTPASHYTNKSWLGQETILNRDGYVTSKVVNRKMVVTISTAKELLDLFLDNCLTEVYTLAEERIDRSDLEFGWDTWDLEEKFQDEYQSWSEKYGEDNIRLFLDSIYARWEEQESCYLSKAKLLAAKGKDDSEIHGSKKESAEMVLQYHGLAAYSGQSDFAQKLINCMEEDYIICGSDRAIGPVGILFEGPVFKMYGRDIWSHAEDRQAVDRDVTCSEEDFLSVSKKLEGNHQYIETFTQVERLFAIWCHDDVPQHIKDEVEEMAAYEKVKVVYVRPSRMSKNNINQEFGFNW